MVSVGPEGGPTYDFRVAGTADWQWTGAELAGALEPGPDAPVVAVHSGSIALTTPPGAAVLRDLLTRAAATATVSYDPNCRPLLMGEPAEVLAGVHDVLAVADVVKVSCEDLEWLMPGAGPEEVIDDWIARGPALVAVTLGGDGVLARTPTGPFVRRPGARVTVVDTVGAGDTFCAALLAGLHGRGLLGADARPALRALDAADGAATSSTPPRSPRRSPSPGAAPTRPPRPSSRAGAGGERRGGHRAAGCVDPRGGRRRARDRPGPGVGVPTAAHLPAVERSGPACRVRAHRRRGRRPAHRRRPGPAGMVGTADRTGPRPRGAVHTRQRRVARRPCGAGGPARRVGLSGSCWWTTGGTGATPATRPRRVSPPTPAPRTATSCEDRRIDPGRILLLGESLGAAVATRLAVERPVGGLVLRSPFTDMAAVAERHYPFLPARALLRDRFDVLGRVGAVPVPVVVVAGGADEVVPSEQSRAVAVAGGARWIEVPGARHNDAALGSGDAVVEAVVSLADAG